jgi:hypothetical protein
MVKYINTDFDRMVAFYRSQGIGEKSGLYWNGLVGYNNRKNLDHFHEIFEYIKDPTQPYHPQGQMSLVYVISKSSCAYANLYCGSRSRCS